MATFAQFKIGCGQIGGILVDLCGACSWIAGSGFIGKPTLKGHITHVSVCCLILLWGRIMVRSGSWMGLRIWELGLEFQGGGCCMNGILLWPPHLPCFKALQKGLRVSVFQFHCHD